MTPPVGLKILVCGRWDAEVTVVDLDRALNPAARDKDAAIVNRVRVTPDIMTPTGAVAACGLPVSVCVAQDIGRIFVVNHAGNASPDDTARMPHGHAGTVAVLDLVRTLQPSSGQSAHALLETIELQAGGPVACVMAETGHLLVTSAEGRGTEDGGSSVAVVDAVSARVVHSCVLEHRGEPSRSSSPSPEFGGFPNPNGIAISSEHDLVFTANGGTNDVSVLSLSRLLASEQAEIGRVPVSSGPFGLAVSPDQRLLATADREDAASGKEGAFISIVSIPAAASDPANAVVARILVGTDDEEQPSRPIGIAFSPAGDALYVTCTRSGTVSRIDVAAALTGARQEVRRTLTVGQGTAAPRGVLATPDGRFVVVAGGQKLGARSGTLWVLDAADLTEVGRVSGVGNEPYFIATTGA